MRALAYQIFGALIILAWMFAAHAETLVTIPPDGLNAFCDYEDHLYVNGPSGSTIYETSRYLSGDDACPDARMRLDGVLQLARTLGKKIKMRQDGNHPDRDFSVVNADGSPGNKISASGLRVLCVGEPGRTWLEIEDAHENVIYTTSRYGGWGGCPDDADIFRARLSTAELGGKLVQIKDTDTPGSDLVVTDETDPRTQRASDNRSGAGNSGQ